MSEAAANNGLLHSGNYSFSFEKLYILQKNLLESWKFLKGKYCLFLKENKQTVPSASLKTKLDIVGRI